MRSIGFGMAKLLLLAAAAIAQEHSTIYVGSNKGLFRTTDGGNTSETCTRWTRERYLPSLPAPMTSCLPQRRTDCFGVRTPVKAGLRPTYLLPYGRASSSSIRKDPNMCTPAAMAYGEAVTAESNGSSSRLCSAGHRCRHYPPNPALVFASTAAGIYRSADSGVNWHIIPNSPPVDRMVVAASVPFRLIAAGKQVFLSTDLVDTWLSLRIEVGRVAWYAAGLSAWGGLDVDVSLNCVRRS